MSKSARILFFFNKLARKKHINPSEETSLARVLTTCDLIGLGIGSTLGAGIYVVAGQVARQTAGPSVVLSFLIAAVASVFAGICYAEFAARVPKAGSAYVYSYVTVGELIAFVIGWNLILEYVIGTASVARAWSSYFDSLVDNKIQDFFKENMPMHVSGLSEYPDFFAFSITLVLTVLLAVGVKESTMFNNIFTVVNLLVVTYVVVCGLFKVDGDNWSKSESEVPSDAGTGGFMPFGFSGMMSGAATCFYAFVGFDCVATTGEEAKNPQRAIPMSIVVSLLAITLAYCSLSTVLTLLCPYYLLDPNAPLPLVFDRLGWGVAKYIIAVGAICGLSTSLLGAMFPLPRILYAMGNDGLLFRFLGKVIPRFQTPVVGTMISGVFAGAMAMLFDLKELVDMMSIGTLLAYTLVAVCVLILRYQTDEYLTGEVPDQAITRKISSRDLFSPRSSDPTSISGSLTSYSVGLLLLAITALCAMLIYAEPYLVKLSWWAILLTIVFGSAVLLAVIVVWRQPQNKSKLWFKVPGLPWIPALSAFINIYLMMKLSVPTWIRFGVWMAIGFAIYFGYGVRNSSENNQQAMQQSRAGQFNRDIEDRPPAYQEETDKVDEKEPLLSGRNHRRNASRIGINVTPPSTSVNEKTIGDDPANQNQPDSDKHVYANVTGVSEPKAPFDSEDDAPVHSEK
ncbi:cationic amino acid transporter 3-like isoform X1 [Haliotis rufescens]|uniref:cationic amino acid transporter 3-like isoform X1 n=1 Tax=Haliotis rufescens TaxID=6454 RepID=UPI00201EB324|nr:cationic amino acid transporter 3-like isoform X1 [Haliotis rufescens]XP_048250129.1 cationic amino acid transporter 3-like isoform X1 [Haliotis rufescens]